jgi:hypothetical protein
MTSLSVSFLVAAQDIQRERFPDGRVEAQRSAMILDGELNCLCAYFLGQPFALRRCAATMIVRFTDSCNKLMHQMQRSASGSTGCWTKALSLKRLKLTSSLQLEYLKCGVTVSVSAMAPGL